jgi:hypothetical protein
VGIVAADHDGFPSWISLGRFDFRYSPEDCLGTSGQMWQMGVTFDSHVLSSTGSFFIHAAFLAAFCTDTDLPIAEHAFSQLLFLTFGGFFESF